MSLDIPERIYAQYRDKPKAVAWYNITKTIGNDLCDGLQKVRETYDIDSQSGAQLDVIGRIVGIDRSYKKEIDFTGISWGATGTIESQFGRNAIQFTGSGATINKQVDDTIYRLLIKSKIETNTKDATIESILEGLSVVVGTKAIKVIDAENMSFSVEFETELHPVEIFVLNTFRPIQKPQGVRFDGFLQADEITQYGGDRDYGHPRAQYAFTF